jgi:hypothetical protein
MRRATTAIFLLAGVLSGNPDCLSAFTHSPQQPTPKIEEKAKISQAHPEEKIQIPPNLSTLACSVSGTVRDASGAPVPGAAVKVIDASGAVHSLASDATGFYCALGLAPGKYSVLIEKQGFRSTRLEAVTIAADHAARADVVMPIAGKLPLEIESGYKNQPPPPPPPPSPAPTPVEIQPSKPATVPSPVHSAKAPDESPATSSDDLGVAEAKWFSQLPNGSIQYNVPPVMTIGQPSAVSVTINGYKAPPLPPQADGTAPAPLKVSEWMRVEISQPGNPDEFTIAGDPNQNPQFVPIDAGATWTWTVTPTHLGQAEKLQFRAYVLYRDDKSRVQRELPSTERVVTVRAEGVSGIARNVEDNFWLNPINWFKYMLPGGAGFAALVALIGWWQKRRNKPEADKVQAKNAAK